MLCMRTFVEGSLYNTGTTINLDLTLYFVNGSTVGNSST